MNFLHFGLPEGGKCGLKDWPSQQRVTKHAELPKKAYVWRLQSYSLLFSYISFLKVERALKQEVKEPVPRRQRPAGRI